MYFFPSILTVFRILIGFVFVVACMLSLFFLSFSNISECYSPHAMDICRWSLFILKNFIFWGKNAERKTNNKLLQYTILEKYPYSSGGRCENKSTTNSATAYIIWRWQEKENTLWTTYNSECKPPTSVASCYGSLHFQIEFTVYTESISQIK